MRVTRSPVIVATRRRVWMRLLPLLLLLAAPAPPAQAQTVEDGIMLERKTLFAGNLYAVERWDKYWEGTLERENGNIGTVTTRTNSWFANYGVTDRLNVIAVVPYVWTRPSQGVLQSMQGFQDITLAGKYNFLRTSSPVGVLRAMAVGSAGIPLTDYTPDFQPLSIGSGSRRVSGRVTLNLQSRPGWFANASTAYTWRAKVTLDRPYYYTDGHLVLSNEVDMPNVFDYVLSGGYLRHGLMATFAFSQQRTQGGGDIRRQDMPFVSNRMNFSKVGGMVMYTLPKLRGLAVQGAYTYTLDGRNVGRASTATAGLLYTLPFHGRPTQ